MVKEFKKQISFLDKEQINMLEIIKKRRSCRKYDARPVEDEKINEVVQAGLLAPSAINRQSGSIIVIKDKATRDALMEIKKKFAPPRGENFDPFYGAPVILLVIAKKWPLAIHDGAAMMENMLLEATNQGLGTCWVHCDDNQSECKEFKEFLSSFGLNPDEYVGVGHVLLGYSLMDGYPEKTINEGRVFVK